MRQTDNTNFHKIHNIGMRLPKLLRESRRTGINGPGLNRNIPGCVEMRQKKVAPNRQKLTNSVVRAVYNGSIIHDIRLGRGRQMTKKSLLGQLQTIRFRLHELAEARGSLTDPEVLALSEEADRLIVVLQQMQRDELTIPARKASRL
jgi:hypothetical protein